MSQRHTASLHMTCARCRVEVEFTQDTGVNDSTGTVRHTLDLQRERAEWNTVEDPAGDELDLCPKCIESYKAWLKWTDYAQVDRADLDESVATATGAMLDALAGGIYRRGRTDAEMRAALAAFEHTAADHPLRDPWCAAIDPAPEPDRPKTATGEARAKLIDVAQGPVMHEHTLRDFDAAVAAEQERCRRRALGLRDLDDPQASSPAPLEHPCDLPGCDGYCDHP